MNRQEHLSYLVAQDTSITLINTLHNFLPSIFSLQFLLFPLLPDKMDVTNYGFLFTLAPRKLSACLHASSAMLTFTKGGCPQPLVLTAMTDVF